MLDVSYNLLKMLPVEIGNLKNLEYLNLNGNVNLKKLPCTLANISSLKKIDLEVDNFVHPPSIVVAGGLESIMRFLCEGKLMNFK